MYVYPDKNKFLEIKKKLSYFNLTSSKTPMPLKSKNKNKSKINIQNCNLTNPKIKNIHPKQNFNTITNENKTNKKLSINKYSKNFPHLKNFITSKNSIENESIKRTNILKVKDYKKNFTKNFFTNFYDINNNNYFVNLYDSSSSIPQKYKGKNSVINKNFYSKINSRNIDIKDNSFFKNNNKTNIYEASITEPDIYNKSVYITNISDTKEMLKNYRNKLLKEFMKYLKKFYMTYYKKYYIYFINELKLLIKKKKSLKQYVYSKKIQKRPKIFKKLTYADSLKNKRKAEKYRMILNNFNNNSFNLTERNLESKNIVSKIINNQSNELLDGKIRNIFLDSSFLNEANSIDVDKNKYYYKTSSSIDNNHSYRGNRHRMLLGEVYSPDYKDNNCREIKININQIEKIIKEKEKKSVENKINLRFNYIELKINKVNNNINTDKSVNSISNLVDSFSIVSKNLHKKNKIFEGRKKYFNLLIKNKKFLSSIKEEDEKFSLSIQDSIPADNTKIYLKDNIQAIQNKIKFKTFINSFYKEKYIKLLLSKIKNFADVYNMNKGKT